MRVLIQRVSEAAVRVDDRVVGEIGPGLLLLVGVTDGDTEEEATFLANKVANLRIFEDEEGKMNRSALELGLSALVVSQFTLYADTRKGRRPSFIRAAAPEVASPLVDYLAQQLRELGLNVATGEFGAHMHVSLVNDGPVTIWLDTDELR
ncbi:D-aminoacyl-tRNA deacylase [Sphaerobacter thermophilus]|jgi:D-tyrosyl-tRNA(Tyr) deacylase|uniref:D-aminoacyl-tRNA deacylase n=1 Tax=Sphaerobacter thermophilus (strain ATCC 49802 / DSM 20745 / KCCM 41009 / NCIMB 13125 / S 6022) TaxID=479434 RepID=D1C1M9_SPHTD|nr:D-aminoacyl-tRNA deacylase [Sphaerobacter thermophilus]ACZ38146.1 D-tyrosyl-tRNA(Tyr) deacylase [Sphaerobacter thermophilus DSM 20745]PZN63905.1 MAG: D-tyrosyl-tRNA(Tyr) deacylase [Sphaerobacter thermophilus]